MTRVNKTIAKSTSLILCISFILMIALPGAALLSDRSQSIKLTEKRELAHFPELSWHYETIKQFPKRFDQYFRDNFGYRNELITLFNTLQVKGLGQSPVPAVVIGKDGWLFNALDGALEDYYGQSRPTTLQVETWRQTLELRKKWFEQLDIQYNFVIAPNKHTIYPEFLPNSVQASAGVTRRAAIHAHFEQREQGPLIDLSDSLLAAKKPINVYHKTDSHWNEYGAYIAAQNTVTRIIGNPRLVDSMSPAELLTDTVMLAGDLAIFLGLEKLYNEDIVMFRPQKPCAMQVDNHYAVNVPGGHTLEVYQCDNAPIQAKALVIHDSFGKVLKPYLSEYFSETVYVSWGDIENYRYLIDPLKPDYVIDERAERNLAKALRRDVDIEMSVYDAKFDSPERYLFQLRHDAYEHQIKKFQNLRHWRHEGELALELLAENAAIDIDYAPPGEGKTALLKLVVSSSTQSLFSARYRENDPAGTGIKRQLKPGLNTVFIAIPPQQVEGPIQLMFDDTDFYIIHSLQIIED